MKKRIALFVLLISLFSIVAEAAFSGKYLCVRKNFGGIQWTYKKRLYTTTDDMFQGLRLAVRHNGAILYAPLKTLDRQLEGLQILVSGERHAVAEMSLFPKGSFSVGVAPKTIAVGGSEIFVSNESTVMRYPKAGGSSTGSFVLPGGSVLTGMKYNAADGNLYITDAGRDVVEVRTTAGALVRTIASVANPDGIDFDASGNVVFARNGAIETRTVYGSVVSSFSISSAFFDLAVEKGGRGVIILADGYKIVGYYPGGAVAFQTLSESAGMGAVRSAVITPSNNVISSAYFPEATTGSRSGLRLNYIKAYSFYSSYMEFGRPILHLFNDNYVYGMALDPTGFLYVGDTANNVVRLFN